ncbi:PaaI family thioesterase [Piscinibacter sakaiensis]|uniref:Phenylacetic acid degradation protein paaI n=1 Tax=Piscinibacter sakaiensis TaxID=1547922 RepID=A0A0K8P3Z8_PISS1|nr:PaaI family thioesterase [Piscinibacter sakaiensis]GAP37284.1 phenylacetic acid degradation protein paaI [Piscinibacter sakaiensis]
MQVDLATVRGFFAASPFVADLGLEVLEAAPGRIVAGLAVVPRHTQHTGVVHAGVLTTLADHAMGAAAQTLAPDGLWVLTAELKISLLRGARAERLWCAASVLKPGRRLSFTEAEVWAEAGGERRLVVKASATMALTEVDAG